MKPSIGSKYYPQLQKQPIVLKSTKDKKPVVKKTKVPVIVRHTFLCGGKLKSYEVRS